MVRGTGSVIAGAIVWMVVFYTLAASLALIWPEYKEHARVWAMERTFIFATVTACFNLVFWVLAEISAGWVVMKIGRRHLVVWVLAALLQTNVTAIHIVFAWSTFPWWYNLGVVIPAIPAILLGAWLAGGFRSSAVTVAA